MNRVRLIIAGSVLVSFALTEVGCARRNVVGTPAPDFTLKDLAGKNVSLAQFEGQPVLLSFWAVG